MKTLITLILFTVGVFAQTSTTTSTTTVNQSTLPVSTTTNFAYGVTLGGSYTQNATPQAGNGVVGAWVELGTNSGLYSITHFRMNSKYSTVDTGFAKVFAKSGNFTLGGLLSAGLSTANPVIGNFSGGAFLKYDLVGVSSKLTGISVVGELGVTGVSATTAVVPNQVTPNFILSIGKFF